MLNNKIPKNGPTYMQENFEFSMHILALKSITADNNSWQAPQLNYLSKAGSFIPLLDHSKTFLNSMWLIEPKIVCLRWIYQKPEYESTTSSLSDVSLRLSMRQNCSCLWHLLFVQCGTKKTFVRCWPWSLSIVRMSLSPALYILPLTHRQHRYGIP